VAGIAGISVTGILLGAVGPGILLIIMYIAYVIITCIRHPEYAPASEEDIAQNVTGVQKALILLKNIVPLLLIFLVVIGIIFTGVGTATEAAALGALASYILAIIYGKFNFKLLKDTLIGSLRSSAMLLIIIAGSSGFSQVLSFTGASRAAVLAVTSVVSSKVLILIVMLGVAFLMGLFIEQAAIMMICLPLFMPIVQAYDINQIWFAVMFLILLQIGQFTPPVGMSLFALKGVSPKEVTMDHIMKGADHRGLSGPGHADPCPGGLTQRVEAAGHLWGSASPPPYINTSQSEI
jgi:tripartite ATP-independent transporter DctM subunit